MLTVVVADDGRNSFGEFTSSKDEDDEPATPLSQSLDSLEDGVASRGSRSARPDSSARRAGRRGRGENRKRKSIRSPLRRKASRLANLSTVRFKYCPLRAMRRSSRCETSQTAQLNPKSAAPVWSLLSKQTSTNRTERWGSCFMWASSSRISFPSSHRSTCWWTRRHPRRSGRRVGETILDISDFTLLDSMLVASGKASINDDFGARVEGAGKIEVATLPWVLPWLAIDDLSAEFEVEALELESGQVMSGDGTVAGSLRRVRYDDDDYLVAIRGAAWDGVLSAPEGATRTLGLLTVDMSIDELVTDDRGVYRATLSKLDATAALHSIGAEDDGMAGLRGRGYCGWHTEAVGGRCRGRAYTGETRPSTSTSTSGAGGLQVECRSKGVTVKDRGFDPVKMQRVVLTVFANEPLRWTIDEGTPSVDFKASVRNVSTGGKHFRARDWALHLERIGVDVYELSTRINADRVSWGGVRGR